MRDLDSAQPIFMSSASEDNLLPLAIKKKRVRKKPADVVSQKKPNPWGEESYSDLIAKALECAPEKRMKLNEIYQWFASNIAYFRDRASAEEAAGWKVNLSWNCPLPEVDVFQRNFRPVEVIVYCSMLRKNIP